MTIFIWVIARRTKLNRGSRTIRFPRLVLWLILQSARRLKQAWKRKSLRLLPLLKEVLSLIILNFLPMFIRNPEMERILQYTDAIREATDQEMARDNSVIVFGLDVDDPKAIQG